MSAVETEMLLRLRPDERELLSARVLVADERYAVLFTVRDPSAVDGDCVRFALHYYARVLFELVHTTRSTRGLPALIERIVAAGLLPGNDLFATAGVTGALMPFIDDRQTAEAVCVLSSTSHRDFHLRGDLSHLTSHALIGSVIAVLQSVASQIAPEMVDLLSAALANMNASYGVTHRYSEANSIDEVPVVAYHAASFA